MATSSKVAKVIRIHEVTIDLKDCLAIDIEPSYEKYMVILNLGYNVKKVDLTINDVERTTDIERPRKLLVKLYVVLGNNNHNDGRLVRIRADRNSARYNSFGPNVTFGECYLPDTQIWPNFRKAPGYPVTLDFRMIDGNALDRYFYCNSIQLRQATTFKVVGMTRETMNSTAYHELKYVQDSRYPPARPYCC